MRVSLFGRQAAWRPGCNRGGDVKMVGGTVQAAAVTCDFLLLEFWMRGSSSVVKLLGGRGEIEVVSSSRLVALCSLLM